jgi:hypothetical protein
MALGDVNITLHQMLSVMMRYTGHVTRVGKMRNVYIIYVGKRERKRLLGRPRRRLDDNIRMDLREIAWEGLDWMHLDQHKDQCQALVITVMNIRVP